MRYGLHGFITIEYITGDLETWDQVGVLLYRASSNIETLS
jgi:hypothetical protein